MDPTVQLRGIREILQNFNNRSYTPEDLEVLAQMIDDLDTWLTSGGFLPDQWNFPKE